MEVLPVETPLSTALENGAIDQWLKTRRQEGVLTEERKALKACKEFFREA